MVHGKMYVTNTVGGPLGIGTVSQANLDGTGAVALAGLNGMVNSPMDIALDVAAGKMYVINYATAGPYPAQVIQANLDGTGAVSLGNLNGTLYQCSSTGLSLDTVHGKMYVVHYGGTGSGPGVSMANLDGTGGMYLGDLNGLVWQPFGIAMDPVDGKMYVSNGSGTGSVVQANLDGTGGTNLTLNGTLAYPWGLALQLPPAAKCKDVTVSAGSNCTADTSIDDGSYDVNGSPITISQSPAGPYELGETTVTLTVTNSIGDSSSCTATVTVVDTTPPAITCPQGMTVNATSSTGAMVSYSLPAVSDDCSGATADCAPASGSIFAIGDTTIICTATDGSGNTSNCSFNVHVKGASEQIANLIALVQSFNLKSSTASRLLGYLLDASSHLASGNISGACTDMTTFISYVNSQTGKTITAAQASQMITAATQIKAVMNCN
jgi:hypothetical protein